MTSSKPSHKASEARLPCMPLSEALILQLHRDMLKHSDKDQRQRGAYKFGPNRVEAKEQSGNIIGIIFDPTPPHTKLH